MEEGSKDLYQELLGMEEGSKDLYQELLGKVKAWGVELYLALPNIIAAIVVMLIGWFVGKLACKITGKLLSRASDNHASLVDLGQRLVRLVVFIASFLIALSILNLQNAVTTVLAGAGIIGIALGFAFQDLSANFISGVGLALQRPIRVGDIVETNGELGTVAKIELRSTHLRTFNGQLIMIPNRHIYQEKVINYNNTDLERRIDLEVGVHYDTDLAFAKEVAENALTNAEGVLNIKPPKVYFKEFGDSSINAVVQVWFNFGSGPDYWETVNAAILAIHTAFNDNNIEIPFPIRTLYAGANWNQPDDSEGETLKAS